MSAELTESAEIIQIGNFLPIEINYANTKNYYKASSYDEEAMTKGYIWHQIVALRLGSTADISKREILRAIFDAVGDEEMYPIAYRSFSNKDMFLVRQCRSALDKLFKQNLCLATAKRGTLFLRVQLNVAKYVAGQVDPHTAIADAVRHSLNTFEGYKTRRGVLNLSYYSDNKAFDNIHIEMSNTAVLQRICTAITRNDDKYRQMIGINLRENNLTTLTPLSTFKEKQFLIIDLRDNRLSSVPKLVKELYDLKADDLFLSGNPVTNSKSYPEALKPILKNFQSIDGTRVDKLLRVYTSLKADVKVERDGFQIDWSNKSDIKNFQDSDYWHAVIVPDPEHSYPKEQLMHYFLMTSSVTRSEVYPCYYEFNDGQHKFLVRRCFDQLEYLVAKCNLQIKIPQELPTQDDYFCANDDNYIGLPFYLRMNVSKFQSDQVEPVVVIQKEIANGFTGIHRRMNLENFKSSKGFENVYITLSSPRTLSYVLMVVARKFPTITELSLGGNSILSISNSSAFQALQNLERVDLRNNNIHNISDISCLKALDLKSLILEGNPLCAKYQNVTDYVMDIKSLFAKLMYLDTVALNDRTITFEAWKNYVCDVEAADFVELFVLGFFQQFDSDRRYCLSDLYHPQACFTVTCNFNANTKQKSRLKDYRNISRDLKSNISSVQNYYDGVDEIMAVFLKLPKTTHDVVQFTTDMTVFSKEKAVIVVRGIFEDVDPTGGEITMAFQRTFVLKPIQRNAGILRKGTIYKISNDMWTITNPTLEQRKTAFKFRKGPSAPEGPIGRLEKEVLCATFKLITHLKTVWCLRYLNEGKWNLTKALECYTESAKRDEVPPVAFM